TACASSGSTGGSGEGADREVLFQVSLLQGLTFGDYHGSITAGELKQKQTGMPGVKDYILLQTKPLLKQDG
nr:hypothetical protein [Lachnospiraceae bacterium]